MKNSKSDTSCQDPATGSTRLKFSDEASIYYAEKGQSFCFRYGKNSLLEFRKNGDIFIRGIRVANDKEVVYGIREWCKIAGVYPKEEPKG